MSGRAETWRCRLRALKRDTYALVLACRDGRTPWYAKLTAAVVVAYAFSPIDLIPDFIPVLGLLDDLLLVPLGVVLVRRLVPAQVMSECRVRAESAAVPRALRLVAGAAVLLVWGVLAHLCFRLVTGGSVTGEQAVGRADRHRAQRSVGAAAIFSGVPTTNRNQR